MGLFGFAEILSKLEKGQDAASRELLTNKIKHLYPTWNDLKLSAGPIMRGTAIGAKAGRSMRGNFAIASAAVTPSWLALCASQGPGVQSPIAHRPLDLVRP